MPEAITFTEEQITGLFGELAAEDEEKSRFKSSFLKVLHMRKYTTIVL